jgi:hypothetical protein
MSDFDYKKYLAEGGIEAKLQENSIDEGTFDDIGKGIGNVASGVGKGLGSIISGVGSLGVMILGVLTAVVVVIAVGLTVVGRAIFSAIQSIGLPEGMSLALVELVVKKRNKTLDAVVKRLKNDPEILEYVENPSKKGLRNVVLSKLTEEEKAEIGNYIKNAFSRRNLA